MVFFQGSSVLIRFLIVPLALGYLDAARYGLWLVIGSMLSWLNTFDLGLGNGLRNKLAEALTLNDFKLAQEYVSTTFFAISIISIFFLIPLLIIHPFVNWAILLNAPENSSNEFNKVIILCIVFFSVRLVLNLIINILAADQRVGLSRVSNLLSNLFVLISICLLKSFTQSSFLFLCMAMVIPQILVLLGMNIYFFSEKYQRICPSISGIRLDLVKSLGGVGIKIFTIQIMGMIVFSTDNVIITKLFGPGAVTPYNIAFQYMSIATIVFNVILTPAWSAFTEAQALNDKIWIKKMVSRLVKIWLVLMLGIISLVLFSDPFYRFWVGEQIVIEKSLTILMAVYSMQLTFSAISAYYLYGVGKVDLLLRVSVFLGISNIPMSIFLAKELGMGVHGVIGSTILCNFIWLVVASIQSYRLINEKANGIWNR